MDIKTISLWVCIILVALPSLFFGFQKIKQDQKTLNQFIGWGYSKVFMILLGVAEITTAIGLLFSQTRLYAIYFYGVILIGAIFTHLKAKEGAKSLIAPISVLVFLIVIYFLNS
jgi:putative oxidoreductase